MRVINECRVDFQYMLSPQSPVIIKTICSNLVSTDIVKDILKIEKYADKKCTYSFDILTYTICITNISKYKITNVFFQDRIAKGTRFIENSVTINNIKRRCINPEYGFNLYSLEPEDMIIITFKVIVLPHCFCDALRNCSTIEHDYIYNIEKPPARITIESNCVKTAIDNKVFKSIVVDNILKTCDKIQKIIDVNVRIKILETKPCSTPVSEIYKICNSNICTLVILGSIEYKVNYLPKLPQKRSKHRNDKIKYTEDIFGFSCYMLVPVGITYSNKDNINIDIENICINLVGSNNVFVNTNLLLYY